MFKDLIDTFNNSSRRFLKINTNFLAAIFSGLPIAILFSLVWLGPKYNNWELGIVKWVIYLAFILITLYGFYKFGIFLLSFDLEEKQGFHDNFFVGLFVAILISLAIIFHLFIKENIWISVVIIIVVPLLYFALIYLFFKRKRPK